MKKIIILCSVFLFLGSGCRDFLHVIPKNQKIVASLEDVRLEIYSFLSMFIHNGAYQTVDYGNVSIQYPLRSDAVTSFCMYSDDLLMSEFLGKTETNYYMKYYYENVSWKGLLFSKNLWDNFYGCIGFLNTVIKDAGKFKEDDPVEYERIVGEAGTIRAYYFFKLLAYFAPYKNDAFGIPVNLDQDDIEPKPRTSQRAVYDMIIGELKAVLDLKAAPTAWNVFYSREAASAALAQVYWFKALSAASEPSDWENAEKYAAAALENYTVENSVEAYDELFASAGTKVIKQHPHVLIKYMNRQKNETGSATGVWGNGSVVIASDELISLYKEPNDIRLAAFFNISDENGKITNYVNKYHFDRNRDGVCDIGFFFRASDLSLICAEAYARQNKLKEAKELLVAFKQAKIPGYTTFEGDVLKEILLERRKEFCYESDMRWLDMKRLGVSVERLGMSPDEEELVTFSLSAEDYRYALPIPGSTELEYNLIEQNPGWGNVE